MTTSTKKYSDIWKSPSEYFEFCMQHKELRVFGTDAIKLKQQLEKKKLIGEPKIGSGK